jgi:phosphoribosylanthranilate isomerase
MPVEVKVCGLTDAAALAAAAEGGARYLGFVFYPPSPRALTPVKAAALAATAPARCAKVGVLVDPDDALLGEILAAVPLDYLQLHGAETPERVAQIKARTGCAVIKVLKIADAQDLVPIPRFEAVADMLLFDAKPPRAPGRLPGGNGLSFDWRLLQGLEVARPWLLSGGLSADNLATAVHLCAARAVDVSSGVERRPGHKDPAQIRRFLEVAAGLGAPAPLSVT